MSETAVLAEAEPPVEARNTPTPIDPKLSEPAPNLAVDLTLARIAGDNAGVARIGELIAQNKGEVKPEPVAPVEEVKQPTAEEIAATEQAKAKVETEQQEAEEAAEIEAEASGEMPKKGFRTRFSDPEDVAIASLARTQKIPLAEAARIRAEITGKAAKPAEQEVEQVIQPDPTIVALEAEVTDLEEKYSKTFEADAMDGSLPVLTTRLMRANAKLESARSAAKTMADMQTISKQERVAGNQAAFNREVESVKEDVAKAYPPIKDPKSPLSILVMARAKEMQDPSHPEHAEIFKPTVLKMLAEKVAAEINLAPVGGKPVSQTQKPAEKAPVRPVAGSRGSAPAAPKATAEQAIAEIKAAVVRAIAGGHYAAGNSRMLSGTIIL